MDKRISIVIGMACILCLTFTVAQVSAVTPTGIVDFSGDEDATFTAAKLIDGDIGTAGSGFAVISDDTTSDSPDYVTGHVVFDLGDIYTINTAKLFSRNYSNLYNPSNVDFYYFSDDDPYNNLLAGTYPLDDIENDSDIISLGNYVVGTYSHGTAATIDLGTSVTTRYIGMRVNDSYESSNNNFQLSEVSFEATAPRVPAQNEAFNVPEVGSVTIDGDLSDWADSTEWSDDFIKWNTTDGQPDMNSTTKAKFAWNDAENMLYVAVQTDQANGGHLVVGVGITGDGIPHDGVGATQLAFDAGTGTDVSVMNEIAYYGNKYNMTNWALDSGTDGIEAAQTNDGSTWTYELAIPYWTDWEDMDTKQDISSGNGFYAYLVMEDVLEGATGTNMTFDGNQAFHAGPMDETSALLTFVAPVAGDANRDGKVDGSDVTILAGNWQVGVDGGGATWDQGDFNGDGKVDGSDVTILAGNWQYGVSTAAAGVPEPGTIMLLLSAVALLVLWRQTH